MEKSTKVLGIFGLVIGAVGGSIAYQRTRKPKATPLSEEVQPTPVNYPPLGPAPAPEKTGPAMKAKNKGNKKKLRGKNAKRRAKDRAKNHRLNGKKK
jgi:hypothetical protein